MVKYTSFWILRGMVAGPRAWLVVLVALSLIVSLGWPAHIEPGAGGAWLPAVRRGWWWRWRHPSRIGRWLWRVGWIVRASSLRLVCRVGLLGILVELSGLARLQPGLLALAGLPVVEWGLSVSGLVWPRLLRRQWYRELVDDVQQMYRWSILGLALLACRQALGAGLAGLVMGNLVVCERQGSRVELEARPGADGQTTYWVHLSGEFEYEVTPRDEFEKRLLILDLRRLRAPGQIHSRWGVVTQEALAQVFGVVQENISRWEGYARQGQWANLFGLNPKSWLTDDLRQQIVDVWACNIWQTAEQVRQSLASCGTVVALRVVEEAGRQSGLMQIRARLKEQGVKGPEGWQPRDRYVVEQLFELVEQLQAQLAAVQALPPQLTVEIEAVRCLGGAAQPEKRLNKPWPWLFQVEHVLFGQWQNVDDATVRCIYCGSANVAVKSKQPRRKVYLDEHGQRRSVEVYRYYCKNPDCPYQTFTNLPPGLLPHSAWTLDARLRALELYTGLRTSYRAAANALGVAPATLYHWLDRFGGQPLQVAALFGLVRSSGSVGIDEKYVQVPKNAKPAGPFRKWMYVYVAVDVQTLDLLHITLYPNRGQDTARLFLLELRAKGYQPRVIITDLSPDYPAALAAVFPNAIHHQCVFHALQNWHRAFKQTFGRNYATTRPELFQLRQEIDHIFQATTRRTVQHRYERLMARRAQLIEAEPLLAPILTSLEHHFPLLLNAYDHPLIPLTNNAAERLIYRFALHYQNFAGFDSLETARCYLHLFELTYRLTPFGSEVQPHLRGKCPLELAGYDLAHVPLARYLREHSLSPLIPAPAEVVPK